MKVRSKVLRAYRRFMQQERQLLTSGTNERSLTHRFAIQVERLFPDYHVDCEYNRDGHKPKRLDSFRKPVDSDDTKGVTVYPDVIVHRRGPGNNLVVIEAKLSSSDVRCSHSVACRCDRCKLCAYKAELGYEHAFYVVFPVGRELENYADGKIGGYVTEME